MGAGGELRVGKFEASSPGDPMKGEVGAADEEPVPRARQLLQSSLEIGDFPRSELKLKQKFQIKQLVM
ncbi:hypothetical protein GOP47_0015265 [Adiantum capillus-veneris]|uniref:Uncharacterized protein n=1 Tax=Adiantum capillus-veneris TaxID=13818 RepID=A0A9D4ZBI0_ADICA|nr:hypothetical protein GOP47_0015265 [Adiantum capillus-veneris]